MGRNRVRVVLPRGQQPEDLENSEINLLKMRLYRAVRILRADKYCRCCTALLHGSTDLAIATRIFNGDDLGLQELLQKGKDAGW